MRSAVEAARIDALSKIAGFFGGINIEAKTVLRNFRLERDEKIIEITGEVQYSRLVGEPVFGPDGSAEVIVEVPIKGGEIVVITE